MSTDSHKIYYGWVIVGVSAFTLFMALGIRWSFGVFCHNNIEHIEEALVSTFSKAKAGAVAAHEYGDWEKLEAFGWENTIIPSSFKEKPDDEIWWPEYVPYRAV